MAFSHANSGADFYFLHRLESYRAVQMMASVSDESLIEMHGPEVAAAIRHQINAQLAILEPMHELGMI